MQIVLSKSSIHGNIFEDIISGKVRNLGIDYACSEIHGHSGNDLFVVYSFPKSSGVYLDNRYHGHFVYLSEDQQSIIVEQG